MVSQLLVFGLPFHGPRTHLMGSRGQVVYPYADHGPPRATSELTNELGATQPSSSSIKNFSHPQGSLKGKCGKLNTARTRTEAVKVWRWEVVWSVIRPLFKLFIQQHLEKSVPYGSYTQKRKWSYWETLPNTRFDRQKTLPHGATAYF